MTRLVLFNKPFQVLSQFTDTEGRKTLADYLSLPQFRAAGRLDYDSEGLLLLTDNGRLQQKIANPKHKLWKTYWVHVEGNVTPQALESLRSGLMLKDGPTLPAKVSLIKTPVGLWPRTPPVRERKTVPDCWLELSIREGRNRQVRRMTAAVGFPTLRLIRCRVGGWEIGGLRPGEFGELNVQLPSPRY